MSKHILSSLLLIAVLIAMPGIALTQSTNAEFPLSAVLVDSGKVKLNWSFPSGVAPTYAVIYRAQVNSATGAIDWTNFTRVDSTGPRYEYKDTPPVLLNGGSYAYKVAVGLSTGMRAFSATAFVYFPPTTPAQTFRLSAYLDTERMARLQWIAPAHVTVLKYYVYRMMLNSTAVPFELSHAVCIDSTTGLESSDALTKTQSGIFAYQVIAKPSAGLNIPSNPCVLAIDPPPVIQYINLTASINDSGNVLLKWETPAGSVLNQYYIYRAAYDPRIMTFAPIFLQLYDSTKDKQFIDRKLTNTSYGFLYQVRAKTGNAEIISNTVEILTLNQIVLTAYLDNNGTSVQLKWTTPVSGAPRYYLVERNQTDLAGRTDSTKWMRVDSLMRNECKDTPQGSASAFLYRVRAFYANGTILVSNIAVIPWRPPVTIPFTLTANITSTGSVELEWNDAYPFVPSKFYLYRAVLARNVMRVDSFSPFDLVDSTSNRWIVNTPPLNVSNAFAYYVEARGEGQTRKTNYVTVIINVPPVTDRVTITSEPVREGRVGMAYTYQPKAVSSHPPAVFQWYLGGRPPGMTIDSTTGSISWTPSLKGWFKVSLYVLSSKGGKAYQEFDIAVAGATGFVQGTVTDTLGNPIAAIVQLFKRDVNSSFEYRTMTNEAGKYTFKNVDVGTYIAYAAALKGDFVPQWYYQKKTPALATLIPVADSATVDVNFVLQARAAVYPFFTVSGEIKDSSTGKALSGAVVVFTKVEFMLNSAKNTGSSVDPAENMREVFSYASASDALKGSSPFIFRSVTDTAGKYSVRIPQGKYISLAFAQGYQKLFYNNQTDLLSADILALTKDTSSISFLLKPLPTVALGSISGTISDTSKTVTIPARVIVFREKPGKVESYYTDADTTGAYTVGSLPPGDYYVLAIPLGNFAPSFYCLSGPTMKWKLASKVYVNGTSVSGIDIKVYPLSRTGSGYTYIQGAVTTPKLNKVSRASVSDPGVNGSLIYAADPNGDIAGYSVSDANGNYSISGLSPQTYTVTSDRIGYDAPASSTASPTYDPSGNPQPASASFNMIGTTTDAENVGAVLPTEYVLSQNYPNPFNPSTQITFALPQSEKISITIYNLLGQKVVTLADGLMSAGSHTLTWNGRNEEGISAATGVYFYQLKGSNYTAIRKMLLLK